MADNILTKDRDNADLAIAAKDVGSGPGPMIYRKPGEDRKPFQSRRRRRNEALLFSGAL